MQLFLRNLWTLQSCVDATVRDIALRAGTFRCQVVAIVYGIVATNIMAQMPENYQLPPGSIYQKIFREIKARANGGNVEPNYKMDPAEYVSKAVSDILYGANGLV